MGRDSGDHWPLGHNSLVSCCSGELEVVRIDHTAADTHGNVTNESGPGVIRGMELRSIQPL